MACMLSVPMPPIDCLIDFDITTPNDAMCGNTRCLTAQINYMDAAFTCMQLDPDMPVLPSASTDFLLQGVFSYCTENYNGVKCGDTIGTYSNISTLALNYTCSELSNLGCCVQTMVDVYQLISPSPLEPTFFFPLCAASTFAPACPVAGTTETIATGVIAVECLSFTWMEHCMTLPSCADNMKTALMTDIATLAGIGTQYVNFKSMTSVSNTPVFTYVIAGLAPTEIDAAVATLDAKVSADWTFPATTDAANLEGEFTVSPFFCPAFAYDSASSVAPQSAQFTSTDAFPGFDTGGAVLASPSAVFLMALLAIVAHFA